MKQEITFKPDGTATLVISAIDQMSRADINRHQEDYSYLECPKYHDADMTEEAIKKWAMIWC